MNGEGFAFYCWACLTRRHVYPWPFTYASHAQLWMAWKRGIR